MPTSRVCRAGDNRGGGGEEGVGGKCQVSASINNAAFRTPWGSPTPRIAQEMMRLCRWSLSDTPPGGAGLIPL